MQEVPKGVLLSVQAYGLHDIIAKWKEIKTLRKKLIPQHKKTWLF